MQKPQARHGNQCRLALIAASNGILWLGDRESGCGCLVGTPGHHQLTATVTDNPRIIVVLVGQGEGGRATLLALAFDREPIGHHDSSECADVK